MEGRRNPVRVKVLSCLGAQPICKTFLPRLANAVEILQLIVDLPIQCRLYRKLRVSKSKFVFSLRYFLIVVCL